MRCPTCSDTPHPGFIAWREVEGRDGAYWRDLRPCPECGERATAEAIQRALEFAGVEFTNGDAPGVKLRKAPR
jgi:hypothetical protein